MEEKEEDEESTIPKNIRRVTRGYLRQHKDVLGSYAKDMIVAGLGEEVTKRIKNEEEDVEDFEKTTTAKSVPDKTIVELK